jgi:hypothetical protein
MRFGMFVSAAAVALTIAGSVFAQADAVRKGVTIVDQEGKRIAQVDRVNTGASGSVESVSVIFDSKYVTIPANTLSPKDGKLVTSLSKAQVLELSRK